MCAPSTQSEAEAERVTETHVSSTPKLVLEVDE